MSLHPRKLFIKNLSFKVQPDGLENEFSRFGPIKACQMPQDGGKYKG